MDETEGVCDVYMTEKGLILGKYWKLSASKRIPGELLS